MDLLLDLYILGIVVLMVLVALYGFTTPHKPRKTNSAADDDLYVTKSDSGLWGDDK